MIKTGLDSEGSHTKLQSTKCICHCLAKQTPSSSAQKQITSDSVDTECALSHCMDNQCALYRLQISGDSSFSVIVILRECDWAN